MVRENLQLGRTPILNAKVTSNRFNHVMSVATTSFFFLASVFFSVPYFGIRQSRFLVGCYSGFIDNKRVSMESKHPNRLFVPMPGTAHRCLKALWRRGTTTR
jgi:hypothetical protein